MAEQTILRPPSQFVEIDGLPTHWVDFGGPEGAPLAVCVHGLGGSFVNWMALAPLLRERYRVVAPDLAGHGLTPITGRSADIRSNRQLVDGFIRSVSGDRPVTLIGNSMGGMLSILQAARRPDTVERLVLIDPAVPLPKNKLAGDPRFLATFLLMAAVPFAGERLMARRGKRIPPAKLIAQTLRLVCQDPARVDPELIRESQRMAAQRAGKPELDRAFLAAARSMAAVFARPARYLDAIKTLPQPTLLLFGAKDRLVPLAAGKILAARRPDWRFEIHPDLGHVPQIEDPAWTAQQILDWAPVVEPA